EPGLPGPDASSAGCGRAAAGVARSDGLAMVAPARPARRIGPDHGVAPRGGAGPRVGRAGARQLRGGRWGAGGGGPGQQRRGVPEERAADAAGEAPADDPADARPEATVLELPGVPLRAAEGHLPRPSLGARVAHLRLLGATTRRPGSVDATTVNPRKCRVRQ